MSFERVVDKLFDSVKNELQKEKNVEILNNDIIKPIVEQVFNHIYPYVIGISTVFLTMFFAIFIILFLNIRVHYF